MDGLPAYDPDRAPDPAEWLSIDEWDRIGLIGDAHARLGEQAPNPHLHAIVHCMVENQLALDEPSEIRPALGRLMTQGLPRHEALHLIGDVLAKAMAGTLKDGRLDPGGYRRSLAELGASPAP